MLDQLLQIAAQISWALFGIYTLAYFVLTVRQHGPVLALIRLFSYQVMGPLLLAIGVSLLSLALVFVEPTEVAVIVSVVSPGGIRPQPLMAGLHWIIPVLEREENYPIVWQTYTMAGRPNEGAKAGDDSIRARTSDGQEVRLDCSVIFRINQERAVVLHSDWQTRYIEDFVRPTVRSVVRTQVSQFTVREVNSSARKDLEALLDRLLREEFAEKGLLLDNFLLRDITFTPEYAASIEHKQIALEGEQQALHEAQQLRNRAQGKADAIKVEAQAQSEALKLIAEALQADPQLLTYQYVEKLSPNIRAMLVPNNNPLILPLPDLMETQPLTPAQTTTVTVTVVATPTPGRVPSSSSQE
jgi:regulator of protease activity HflC (stomatin/prohibitin superfamily)